MAHPDVIRVLTAGALNGESPVWSAAEAKLCWADTKGAILHAFDPAAGVDEHWQMPAWIGCFALTGRGAVIVLRTGLYDFDRDTGVLECLASVPCDCRRFTFNDGGGPDGAAVDRDGCYTCAVYGAVFAREAPTPGLAANHFRAPPNAAAHPIHSRSPEP